MGNELEHEFECDEVDVEELAREGKPIPRARRYRIRIDRERYTVTTRLITRLELLKLAEKNPSQWAVHQKLRGGHMDEVKEGEQVDLGARGVERFVTLELAQTDGETLQKEGPALRRTFRLPEDDEAYVNALGLSWETIKEGDVRWLLIHHHPIITGYSVENATLAIRVDAGYPPAKLDMAYFLPGLGRKDGKGIPAVSAFQLEGKQYQQWSRHYAWREGDDTLATHHLRIVNWLAEELRR